jgi:hypothetical protein
MDCAVEQSSRRRIAKTAREGMKWKLRQSFPLPSMFFREAHQIDMFEI